MTKYISYCRRSTNTIQQAKFSLETQLDDIKSFIELNGGNLIGSYEEVRSGTDTERPELQAAIRSCFESDATLIVSKLSRLSRDIGQVDSLYRSQLRIVICEFGIECSYEQILMFGMVNSLMVENLRRATKRGIAKSRASGTKWNCITPEQAILGAQASKRNSALKRAKIGPMLHALKEQGFTYREIADKMNSLGTTTPRGRRWAYNSAFHTHSTWKKDQNNG